MAHSLTVPTLSVLTLLGAGLGVHLGHSAVAEIDPVYFGDPPARFHSDLVPHRPVAAPHVLAGQEVLQLAPACIGCGSVATEIYPIYEAPAAPDHSDYAADAAVAELVYAAEVPPAEEAERQVRLARVELYSSYPVSHDEAAALAEAPAADDQREAPAVD